MWRFLLIFLGLAQLNAGSANLWAAGNLTLAGARLQTMGDLSLLGSDAVRVRDSAQNPFLAQAGGNLYIQAIALLIFSLKTRSAACLFPHNSKAAGI
jgi:hypothetical protein